MPKQINIRPLLRSLGLVLVASGAAWACAYDLSLENYDKLMAVLALVWLCIITALSWLASRLGFHIPMLFEAACIMTMCAVWTCYEELTNQHTTITRSDKVFFAAVVFVSLTLSLQALKWYFCKRTHSAH